MKNDKYIPALSFHFFTRYYDWIIKRVMPKGFREMLVQNIPLAANEMLLDFGTGTAATAILVKKERNTITVIGLDVDLTILKTAKQKIEKEKLDIQLLAYDGYYFPFGSNHFDKVVSCLVFHHLSPEQKHRALTEIFRVLKKGGKVYIADWGLERNKIKAQLLPLLKYFNVLRHIVKQGKGALPEYLLNAGFKNVIETD